MAAVLYLTPPSFSSARNNPQIAASYSSFLPSSAHSVSLGAIFSPQPFTSLRFTLSPKGRIRKTTVPAVVEEEGTVLAEKINGEIYVDAEIDGVSDEREPSKDLSKKPSKVARLCELYVCNLPRSCDSAQLRDMLNPYGYVISAEVDRNDETGVSKGCGYVTMGSINSAKKAIAALDRSDVGGREIRVRFSAEMNTGTKNVEAMNMSLQRVLFYETPHKLYIGNIAKGTKPGYLWHLLQRFGTVVSVRLQLDKREGSLRIYAFVSFFSPSERDAALSLNGTVFRGRELVVRAGEEKV